MSLLNDIAARLREPPMPALRESHLAVLARQHREREARAEEQWRANRLQQIGDHESAHAILATALEPGSVAQVEIIEQDGGIGGCTTIDGLSPADHLIVLCGGEVIDGRAERCWLPASRWREEVEVSHDRAVAFIRAAALCGGDFDRGAELVAEARLTAAALTAKYIEPIKYLSRMLQRRRKLSGADVRAVAQKFGIIEAPAAPSRAMAMNIRAKGGTGPVAFAGGDQDHPILAR